AVAFWYCQFTDPVSVTQPCRTVALTAPSGTALSQSSAFAAASAIAESVRLAPSLTATSMSFATARTNRMWRGAPSPSPLFPERGDRAVQRDDAVVDGHSDVSGIHAGFPVEGGQHIFLKLSIGRHTCTLDNPQLRSRPLHARRSE